MKTLRFRLIGNTTIFLVASFYEVLNNVECVHGVSIDGYQTHARVVDIIWL